jgi:GNAT superfamily N-acetyltransferase
MTTRPSLQFHEATENDIGLILDFIRELAEYERSEDRMIATEETLRKSLFGPRPFAHAFIVYQDGDPVAFAIYFFSFSSFYGLPNLYLEDIFVRPAFRGTGLGKRVFAHLSRIAIEKGCGRMEWSVLNWNEPAIGFYEQLGAEPVRDWAVFHLGRDQMEELAKSSA